jgi:hypothetical protein
VASLNKQTNSICLSEYSFDLNTAGRNGARGRPDNQEVAGSTPASGMILSEFAQILNGVKYVRQ